MKLIVFDCDSTLTSLEGIDELARTCSAEIFQKIEELTNAAMNGEVAIDEIFGRRLEIIQPDKKSCQLVGQQIVENVEPTAKETIQKLKARGWTPIILSGGLTQVIEPIAQYLDIDQIEAVDLIFHDDGAYAGFDTQAPPTRNGGKPQVIAKLRNQLNPEQIVMVGDGISDLETQSEADQFIGFTAYAAREKVQRDADTCITSLDQLLDILN